MHSILTIIKKLPTWSTALMVGSYMLLAGGSVAFGDTAPCTPPPDNQSGVHWPVGADAGTFTYQCTGPYAGYWTNAYYKYDPASSTRYALYDPDYSYDCATKTWTMTEWDYSPASHTFISSRVVPTTAPNLPTGCPVPAPTPATANSSPSSSSGSRATATSNPSSGSASTVSNTGPSSRNTTSNNVTDNSTSTNTNNINIANNLFSNATTGNSFVIGNTTGGSATSGSAQTVANIANLLQSTSGAFGNAVTFTANINGNVNGDFMFDPSAVISKTGPNSTNSATNNLTINTNNTNNTTAQINNNIDVGATSGNATVADNTKAGNATSGNADAIVNLMNLINSVVASGQSFIGTININGNLNGDILLPQNLVNQLLASTGPGSNNSTTTNLTNSSKVTNNTTEGITNAITTSATSGNASVADNTNAGSATSGDAKTNVTILNLTGSNVVGANDLLVFVNVLGHWVGMIVNAPAGTTAAELGGDISSTGPSSNNTTGTNVTDNSTTTNNANLGIVNNVNAHAQTGNATVASNTSGGNATSGNANTAVNVLNMEGSNLNLSNWFGILFINVFGNWTGSFGVNTSAGDPVATTSSGGGKTKVSHTTLSSSNRQQVTPHAPSSTFATFITHSTDAGLLSSNQASAAATTLASQVASVLGTSTTVAKKVVTTPASLPTPDNGTHTSLLLPIIGGSIAFVLLAFSERDRFSRRNN